MLIDKDPTKTIAWLSLTQEIQEDIIARYTNADKNQMYGDFFSAIHRALGVINPLEGREIETMKALIFVRNNCHFNQLKTGLISDIDTYIEKHSSIRKAAEYIATQRKLSALVK